MKTTYPKWNMKKMQTMVKKGELRFDYPVQRASGQWDALQQSLLIHSIVADMPIPPIAVAFANVDSEDGEFVIDGKQRTTTVLGYLSGVKDKETGEYPEGAFKLHAETPAIEVDDEEPVKIAGLYFDQLPEEARMDLLSAQFMTQRVENATDEEIVEIFNRWNNGTPLTKQQKARGHMGTANAAIIDKLQKHPFMQAVAQFTPLQRRRSDDEAVILQSMMLMTKKDDEFTSFVANDMLKFATEMKDADITDITNAVREALDFIMDAGVSSPLFKKLHLPTVIVTAKRAKDAGVSPKVFSAWVEDFNLNLNPRTKDKALVQAFYKQHMGAGSVKKNNVLGRRDKMITHFDEFAKKYKLPKEDAPQAEVKKQEVEKQEPKGLTKEQKQQAIVEAELDKALQTS